MKKWVIGIDEAGRGPLAGPVAVGVVLVPTDFNWDVLPGVTDSKKLSETKREEIFEAARKLTASGQLNYTVSMVSAPVIDRIGIVAAIDVAMKRALKRLLVTESPEGNPRERSLGLPSGENCQVLLDGGLKAPVRFLLQETIIKGDQKEKVIGLASIMAKVTRDRYMRQVAPRSAFAAYNFHINKGYGTTAHREAISRHNLSILHRKTYCKNIKVL